jgi:hypothetical protein
MTAEGATPDLSDEGIDDAWVAAFGHNGIVL